MISGIGFASIYGADSACQDDYINVVFTASNPTWIEPVTTSAYFHVVDSSAPILEVPAVDRIEHTAAGLEAWLTGNAEADVSDVGSQTIVWTHTEAVFEGRSIEANHLLGGKVGEEKGAGNDGEGKTAASEEKSVGAIPFVFTGDPNGERGGCGSEENEGDDS